MCERWWMDHGFKRDISLLKARHKMKLLIVLLEYGIRLDGLYSPTEMAYFYRPQSMAGSRELTKELSRQSDDLNKHK